MAEAIRKAVDVETQLIPSGGGVFEVTADGELIFSKRNSGRFPEDDEILQELRARQRG